MNELLHRDCSHKPFTKRGMRNAENPHGARGPQRRDRRLAWGAIAICMLPLLSLGCSKLLTTEPQHGERFDQPVDGLDNGELGRFQRGDVQFHRGFSIVEGLGPIFNNAACSACHSGDGRGRPENILVRFSRGLDLALGEGGPQIQNRAIPGAQAEQLPAGVDVSRRLPPPVFGMGLIEAIPDSALLAYADPTDADGDGISGRPNWVTPAAYVPSDEPGGGPGARLGRFGRKAQVSNLLQQSVEAYHQDMGITSRFRPRENLNPLAPPGPDPDRASDPEVGEGDVRAAMDYIRMLAPPSSGEWNDSRRRGQVLFSAARCGSCHVPSYRTGGHMIDALSNRDAALYSDLLLHDLGEGLADHRPDGDADGREWRTPPLWKTRIVRQFLNGQLFLMHDGRAHSVDEAIRLHGGEAQAARDAYIAMPPNDRAALIDFVESR
jgi:CxxC motif-containing protein (DUF1111 family)